MKPIKIIQELNESDSTYKSSGTSYCPEELAGYLPDEITKEDKDAFKEFSSGLKEKMKEVDFRDKHPDYEPVDSFLHHFESESEFINDVSSGLFHLTNGFYYNPRHYKEVCTLALKELEEFISSK